MCLTFVVLVHSLIYKKKKVYTEFQGVMTVVIFDPLHGKSRKEFTECLFFPTILNSYVYIYSTLLPH